MYLAARTTATTAETWAIVIVAVICLGFWLIMVVGIAPRPDVRQRHRRQPMAVPRVGGREVPVAGGAHAGSGRSVAPSRDEPATAVPTTPQAAEDTEQTRDDLEPVPGGRPQDQSGQRGGEPRQPGGRSPLDLGGRMPAQREPAADEPESSQRRER